MDDWPPLTPSIRGMAGRPRRPGRAATLGRAAALAALLLASRGPPFLAAAFSYCRGPPARIRPGPAAPPSALRSSLRPSPSPGPPPGPSPGRRKRKAKRRRRAVPSKKGAAAAQQQTALLRTLQSRGHTPSLVLREVGRLLTPAADPDGRVASAVLVRLARLAVGRANSGTPVWTGEGNNSGGGNGNNNADGRGEEAAELRALGTVAAVLAGAVGSGRASTDAGVEGIKAAGVLSRLLCHRGGTDRADCGGAEELFGSLAFAYGEAAPDGMEEHHLSGLRWAYDNLALCLGEDLGLPPRISDAYDALGLPFRIRPAVLDGVPGLSVPALAEQVNFRGDAVRTTSTGRTVPERRLTAWEGDPAVAVPGFAYSGKVMPTGTFSPLVRAARDELEGRLGTRYDCCLLNLYPNGESAMNYHIDPDQDVLWGRRTAVVSVGSARRFAFRPLPGPGGEGGAERRGTAEALAVHNFVVLEGDVAEMFGDCQWRYQHAIKPADARGERSQRSSLVFKQTLPSAMEAPTCQQ